jgi:uncharacterized protein YndB with AHSA1/START domain
MSIVAAFLMASATAPTIATSSHAESAGTSQSVHEIVVDAPRSAVWEAVSTSAGWTGWAATKAWSLPGEPDVIETSYDPQAAPGAPGNIRSRIVLKVPERLLAFRTIKAPEGFADFEALGAVAWVIELEPSGDGATRVRLTGSGFPRTAAGKRIQDFFLAHNPVALQSLGDRFASPRTANAAK